MRDDPPIPDPDAESTEDLRGLARTIAKAGYATRRQAEEMVRSGRVHVDGRRVLDPGHGVGPDQEVTVDGRPLVEVERTYLAFHKPLQVATGATAGHRVKLISQFLPRDIPGLAAAGRLDTNTSGLLLVSNDSEWNAAAASGHGFDKEFLITVDGDVSELQLGVVRAGVQLPKAGLVKPKSIELMGHDGNTCTLSLVLPGGKVRQIRSLFSALRLELASVHRVRIGPVRLDKLPEGNWRQLTGAEVEAIRRGRR